MLSVNNKSAILSRRDIEKVTYLNESLFVQAEQCLGFYTESMISFFSFFSLENRVESRGGEVRYATRASQLYSMSVAEFWDILL